MGEYPSINLKQAREQHELLRNELLSGIDIQAKKNKSKGKNNFSTFGEIAEEWIKKRKEKVDDDTWKKEWSRLERFVLPKLKNTNIRNITSDDLMKMLEPLSQSTDEKLGGMNVENIFKKNKKLRTRGRNVNFKIRDDLIKILNTPNYRRDHLIEYLHFIKLAKAVI